MKKLIFLSFVCISNFAICQSVDDLDKNNGFKNLTLGMSLDAAKKYINPIPYESYPKLKIAYYDVTYQDFLKIGSNSLSSVSLVFFDNKLETITIKTNGFSNSDAVLGTFKNAYGAWRQPNKYIEEYGWIGKAVDMLYNQNRTTGNANIFIFSKEIHRQAKEYKDRLLE